jgi:tRNA1(Val) A37 N6-methylase TrmN6
MDATTKDPVLGGRLRLQQPRHGHRTGHDAILLAAATAAGAGEHAVELGSGVGGAGLALVSRVPGLRVTLLELDPKLVALAEENIRVNRCSERARAVALDVGAPAGVYAAAGLGPGVARRVLMNPPFNDPGRHQTSPNADRKLAHLGAHDGLSIWVRCASRLLDDRGVLTLIWRAEGLDVVLAALAQGFGSATVLPVHPRADEPAIRILVRAVKASRTPLRLLPGFVLANPDGRPTSQAEAVLRGGLTLPLARF